jgi:hypothetical protein
MLRSTSMILQVKKKSVDKGPRACVGVSSVRISVGKIQMP